MSDEGAWVAYVVDDEGGRRYLRSATRQTSGKDFTRHKGSAAQFDSERGALTAAKELKQDYENRDNYRGWIVRVETKRVG
ncbi:MAG: hypothetical protein WCA46_28955 [Actinocatenispora sp.]